MAVALDDPFAVAGRFTGQDRGEQGGNDQVQGETRGIRGRHHDRGSCFVAVPIHFPMQKRRRECTWCKTCGKTGPFRGWRLAVGVSLMRALHAAQAFPFYFPSGRRGSQ